MTPDHIDHSPEGEPENGMLSDTGSLDTTALGILGGATEQVSVSIPVDEDDALDDDGVVDDEVAPEQLRAMSSDAELVAPVDHEPPFDDEPVIEASIDTGEIETNAVYADSPAGDSPAVDSPAVDSATLEWESVAPDAYAGEAATVGFEADGFAQTEIFVEAAVPRAASPAERPPAMAIQPPAARAAAPAAGAPVSEPSRAVPVAHASASTPSPTPPVSTGSTPTGSTPSGSVPTTRREAMHHESSDRAHAVERIHPNPDVTLTSKRLGEFEAGRESSDLLTPDRLLDPHQVVRPEPEGAWQHFVYSLSGHRINLGDGKRARDRKALDRRISVALPGGARFVPVLSRKGGVGKTTVTTLLGMALADARDDRIIAIDANPDRGTLAERIARASGRTIRDLVRVRGDVAGYSDISSIVARDETRLDVLASDADPRVSEALSDRDYHDVASLAAHYYSIVLTDTGTGIVHSVMAATLDVADQFVIVAGLSVDEARLASETLTWLEMNGYDEQARSAVVVLNSARPGAPLVRQGELEAHFASRVRAVVRMPYDPLIAAGSAITFRDLQPATRLAARELAASVVEGLRSLASAA